MPIIRLDVEAGQLHQRCALCARTNVVMLAALQVGAVRPDGAVHPGVILLPACSCGAEEGLFRQLHDAYDLPNRTALHGRVVVGLGEWLVAQGRVLPGAAAVLAQEPAAACSPLFATVDIPPP